MSSRLLRGDGGDPVRWRAVDGSQSIQALVKSGGRVLARPDPAGAPGAAGETPPADAAAWDRKLRALEAEMETKVRAAYARGRAEAEAAAREQAEAALAPRVRAFGEVVSQLAGLPARVRQEAERDVVQLAVAIAARILRRELTTDPGALLGVVKAAVERLNTRDLHRLRVSPEDREHIQAHAAQAGLPPAVVVAADRTLPPGSAVFETARGAYDASVETQLAEIERGFADRLGRR